MTRALIRASRVTRKTNCGPRDQSPIARCAIPARILTYRQTCAEEGLRQRDAQSATSPAMRRSRELVSGCPVTQLQLTLGCPKDRCSRQLTA
jgi:hypothetical protein